MRRSLALLAIAAIAVGSTPAHAAPKKSKTITGHYDVSLLPDPTQDVTGVVKTGCSGLTGKGTDKHTFTVPGAGILTVHLVSPDPTGKGVTDWGLYLVDNDGAVIDHSDGAGSDEQTTTPFSKKQTFLIETCNINGQQDGHITWIFKSK